MPPLPAALPAALPVQDDLDRRANLILSAMDAAGEGRAAAGKPTRRDDFNPRFACRLPAELRLFADPAGGEPWRLFLRDLESRAAGFVCEDKLPLGYGGRLDFTDPRGRRASLDVTLVRCRPCYGGWFEGAVFFHRTQIELDPASLAR